MSQQGTLEIIARELSLALEPLSEAVSSQAAFENFMEGMGWDVDSLPSGFSALGTVADLAVTAMEALGSQPDLDDILDLLSKVKDVYTALKGISSGDVPSGINSADVSTFLADIGEQIFAQLVSEYVNEKAPALHTFLEAAGILENTFVDKTATRPAYFRQEINWNRFSDLITQPQTLPGVVFDWGAATFNFKDFSYYLNEFLVRVGLTSRIEKATLDKPYIPSTESLSIPSLDPYRLVLTLFVEEVLGETFEAGIQVVDLPKAGTGNFPGFAILPVFPSSASGQIALSDKLNLLIRAGTNFASLFGIYINPGEVKVLYPGASGTPLPQAGAGVALEYKPDNPITLLGNPNASRLEMKGGKIGFGANYYNNQVEFEIEAEVYEMAVILTGGDGDGFLSKILGSGEKRMDVPLGFIWNSETGFQFKGSLGFELTLDKNVDLGPISLMGLTIALKAPLGASPASLKIEASSNIKAALGPFTALVERTGIQLDTKFQQGNAGPFDIGVGFKPPNGIGLALDANAVKGGGYLFFDFDEKRYAGVAELTVKEVISLKAIGLLTTVLPGGQDGFSLLLMITAEFTPIQLGFGFTLNGVGGLIGVNRTMKLEVLRDGVKTGTFDHLLFPSDPVGNATQIISELRAIFPPEEKRYVFGLMGLLGWGTPKLVDIKLGLMIEVPSPVRLALLGIVKVVLPDESAPILSLKVAFLGTIDFEKKQLAFDASLYDSRLLAFTLAGDMALRVAWGNNKNFVLSVGGFHPRYQPPPGLAGMQRLTISLLGGNNPRITITNYFAVTSNTVQFGARAELFVKVSGKLKIEGHMGFDALFQFSPFYFIISASASLGIYWKNKMVLGMSASVMLEGPTPWRVDAQVKIKIIFIKIKVKISRTWGDNQNTTLPNTTVYPRLKTALADQANWSSVMPAKKGEYVQIKEIDPADVIAHPIGVMQVSQKEVPLNLEIQKYGNQQASDKGKFEISEVKIAGGPALATNNIREDFAPSQYREMSETEKLSSPDFVKYDAGVSIKGTEDLTGNYFVKREIQYESSILSGGTKTSLAKRSISTDFLEAHAKGGRAGSSALSFTPIKKSALAPEEITMLEENYGVVNISDMKLYDIDSMKPSFQEALDYLSNLVTGSPALRNDLQVVPAFEVAP